MNKRNYIQLMSIFIFLLWYVVGSFASMNTAQITASTLSLSCINWRVSGVCYWLFCTPFGCTVRSSVKVTHYLPDAVVSAYSQPGGNPWTEMSLINYGSGELENGLIGLSGVSAGGGNMTMKAPGARQSNIRFKYADAFGHPGISVVSDIIPGYTCSSIATPLAPYFLSSLDSLAWRSGLPESLYPEALIPGRRELGSQIAANMWGNIYPRCGFVSQVDDDKASAVVAQRVADIITRNGQPHVYQPLTGNRSPGYWPPGEVMENTGDQNHKWQRLAPQLSSSCASFPDGSYTAAENGANTYALWRPYSCCQQRGQTFLSSTDF